MPMLIVVAVTPRPVAACVGSGALVATPPVVPPCPVVPPARVVAPGPAPDAPLPDEDPPPGVVPVVPALLPPRLPSGAETPSPLVVEELTWTVLPHPDTASPATTATTSCLMSVLSPSARSTC